LEKITREQKADMTEKIMEIGGSIAKPESLQCVTPSKSNKTRNESNQRHLGTIRRGQPVGRTRKEATVSGDSLRDVGKCVRVGAAAVGVSGVSSHNLDDGGGGVGLATRTAPNRRSAAEERGG